MLKKTQHSKNKKKKSIYIFKTEKNLESKLASPWNYTAN